MNADTPIPAALPRIRNLGMTPLKDLLLRYGMQVCRVADGDPIPGSYWGDEEAGLIGNRLLVRDDTPLHSALHEASHYICMDATRRAGLHTDAHPTGDDIEENATCYLQCLLADQLAGYSRAQCFADMDAWGYSFVLGSARAWFAQDSEDARGYLLRHGLIDTSDQPTGTLRDA